MQAQEIGDLILGLKYGVAIKLAWGKNGTPTTLATPTEPMAITDLTANKFNVFMSHSYKGDGTFAAYKFRLNANAGSVYANRYNSNGGGDGLQANQTYLNWGENVNYDHFHIIYCCSISGQEKLLIAWDMSAGVAGAGTAPDRRENVAKFVPSPDADITVVSLFATGSGAGTGSNLSALGSDLTPAAAIPFPSDVQEGSRAEITDTRKVYSFESSAWVDIGT